MIHVHQHVSLPLLWSSAVCEAGNYIQQVIIILNCLSSKSNVNHNINAPDSGCNIHAAIL